MIELDFTADYLREKANNKINEPKWSKQIIMDIVSEKAENGEKIVKLDLSDSFEYKDEIKKWLENRGFIITIDEERKTILINFE